MEVGAESVNSHMLGGESQEVDLPHVTYQLVEGVKGFLLAVLVPDAVDPVAVEVAKAVIADVVGVVEDVVAKIDAVLVYLLTVTPHARVR